MNNATANTNVGIGTNAPLRTLHIGGVLNGVRMEGLGSGGSFVSAATNTTDRIMYADAVGDLHVVPAGATGQVLTATLNGPAWIAPSGGSTGWSITGNAGTVAFDQL